MLITRHEALDVDEDVDKMDSLLTKTRKIPTKSHADRGRLALKEGERHHFRFESTYHDLKGKKGNQNNSNILRDTQTNSIKENTNSLVHSFIIDESMESRKPQRSDRISRNRPFCFKITLT